MNNVIHKVNEIIELFYSKKRNPKIWRMGTSIIFILNNIKENANNIKDINNLCIKNITSNKYQMFINDINVTPSIKKIPVSWAAMQQYLWTLYNVGILATKENFQKPTIKRINIIINDNFRDNLKISNIDLILNLIFNGAASECQNQTRDMAYSALLTLLNKYKFDFSKLEQKYQNIYFKKTNTDNTISINIFKLFEENNKYLKSTYNKFAKEFRVKFRTLDSLLDAILNHKNNSIFLALKNQGNPINEITTQIERLHWNRTKQSLFRNKVLNLYSNECILSGVNDDRVLIASHIKPWSESSDNERINPYNGLLLSASIDKLFDNFLISIDENQKLYISSKFIEKYEDKKTYYETLKIIGIREQYLDGNKIKLPDSEELKKFLKNHLIKTKENVNI